MVHIVFATIGSFVQEPEVESAHGRRPYSWHPADAFGAVLCRVELVGVDWQLPYRLAKFEFPAHPVLVSC